MRNAQHSYRQLSLASMALSALIVTLIPTSFAAKPGNTGSQSTASLGISLTVPSSVSARYIQPDTGTAALAKQNGNYLCINSQNPGSFRYFLVDNNQHANATTTQALQLSNSTHEKSDCRLTLKIKVNTTQQNEQTPLLLIVSPE